MKSRVTGFVCALAGLASAGPVPADSVSVIGTNADLVAGVEALRRGRYSEGLALTRSGMRDMVTFDQRAAALNNLCAGYTGLRLFDIAIVYCSQSLELAPGSWHSYNNRALAYLGKGMLKLAQRDVLRGLELNSQAEQLQRVLLLVDDAYKTRPGGPERDPLT